MTSLLCVQESCETLDQLAVSLEVVDRKMAVVAEYFCEDANKFKLETLFEEIISFVRGFEGAVEVRRELEGLREKGR